MKQKKSKKSEFRKRIDSDIKKQYDLNLPEEKRKQLRYAKLEGIFNQLTNRENRYLFYCPDIPFACSLVRIVYEHVNILNKLGYRAEIIHEVKGYKPTWLKENYVSDIKVHYLSEKDKSGKLTKPSFNFSPTDTIVIPDGFWTVMTGFVEIKTLHKVVLALGYGGFMTAEPGANWADLGFTDVLCVSEQIKEDYQRHWPGLNYYVTGYTVNQEQFAPVASREITPTIGLACRSREDAQAIINLFYSKYPFFDMFQFRVLKKMDTETYADVLRHCALQVFIDEKAGHPAPLIEAISCEVPTISVFGRGMSHLDQQQGIQWLPTNDLFIVVEAIAEFCLNWLENNINPIIDKSILNNYTYNALRDRILFATKELQNHKVMLFTAIKTAVDEGKLEDTVLDTLPVTSSNNEEITQSTLTVVKD
jgi:hypothetical protein